MATDYCKLTQYELHIETSILIHGELVTKKVKFYLWSFRICFTKS